MPEVGDDFPPGERPMIAVILALPGHEAQLAAAIGPPRLADRPACLPAVLAAEIGGPTV